MLANRYIFLAALIAAVLPAHSVNTKGAEEPTWPQFRGPNASGLAAEGENPPVEFGPAQNLLWKISVALGHSSPCIWRDRIFLTGFDQEEKRLQVLCVDRVSGRIRWNQIVPAEKIEKVHSVSNPATSTPATDGQRVYVYFGSYGLLCYDLEGKQQWAVPLPLWQTTDGHSTSPIVVGDLVVLNGDEPTVAYLLAVDKFTGNTRWKQPQPSALYIRTTNQSTPVVWQEQLILHLGGELVAYNAADGARVWSVSIATRGTSTPVIGNNAVFVGAWHNFGEPELRVKMPDFRTLVQQHDKDGDGRISEAEFPDDMVIAHRPEVGDIESAGVYPKRYWRMIDSNEDGFIHETEWTGFVASVSSISKDHGLTAIKLGGDGDITRTHVLWQEKKNVAEVPSPLYYGGRVYMVRNGGIVSCVDAENGKLLYCERLGAAGPYYSSLIAANERIYIASGKGIITVFTAGETLKILARNNMGEAIFATPAIVDNKFYVRTIEHVYAFGE